MSNRDLLKEAIADAKAVKETAIANAKAALEEAFTPQIKSMLASQILNEEDDDGLSEADKVIREKRAMEEEEKVKEGYDTEETNEAKEELEEVEELEEEFDLEEILAELDLEEGDDELKEVDDELMKEEEEVDLDGMDDDELKAMIEDVIEDMIANGELETEESEEKVVMADEEEEEEGGEEIDMDDMGDDDLEEGIRDIASKVGKGIIKLGNLDAAKFIKVVKKKGLYDDLKANLDGAARNPKFTSIVSKDMGLDGMKGDEIASLINRGIEMEFDKATGGKHSSVAFEENFELAEALKTIITLKDELNEVNLLNSKLLYTNKIFRNKNLTEGQKVKVLSAFDKATNVKEVKLVYNTLSEGLVAKSGKSQIKESLGMASKPAGVAPKRVINESVVQEDAMVSRFKKLAGII